MEGLEIRVGLRRVLYWLFPDLRRREDLRKLRRFLENG